MNHSDIIDSLGEIIRSMFTDGIVLDDGVRHFLDSTFSVSSRSGLEGLKAPEREDDLDLFIDLALSPDMALYEKLQTLLENTALTKDSEGDLAAWMEKRIRSFSLLFKTDPQPVMFNLTFDRIHRFVSKLHIGYRIPQTLLDTMKQSLSNERRVKTCALFRQNNCPMDCGTEDFLQMFFRDSREFGSGYFDHLRFALSVLSASSNRNHIKSEFVSRLKALRKTREEILAAQDMMKKNTMESLMLQGFRVPPESLDVIESNIDMAGRILSILYGWVDTAENNVSDIDLGRCVDKESIERVIRLLS